jgi:hypothetical protein
MNANKLKDIELCFELIQRHYGSKRAKRSGVLYMNHIVEGLEILDRLGANDPTKAAFCIHPILQEDASLPNNMVWMSIALRDYPEVLMLAMEYRNVANRGLSCYQVDDPNRIYLGPIHEVHKMLIADKVQNRKDFLLHHLGTHPKSIELDMYFKNWLRALGVTEARYLELLGASSQIETESKDER